MIEHLPRSSAKRYADLCALRDSLCRRNAELYLEQNAIAIAADAVRYTVCDCNGCAGAVFYGDQYEAKCDDCLRIHGTAAERENYARLRCAETAIGRQRNLVSRKLVRVYRAEAIFLAPKFGGMAPGKTRPALIHPAFKPGSCLVWPSPPGGLIERTTTMAQQPTAATESDTEEVDG